jgi:uncharacterized protein YfaT (DUF1175 family)
LINHNLAWLLAFCSLAALGGFVWKTAHTQSPVVTVHPDRLLADGYDTALVSIQGDSEQPRMTLAQSPPGTSLEGMRIRSGVVPGRIVVRIEFRNSPARIVELASTLDTRDRAEDGTPDFLRLDREQDRNTFRRWFTYLAEVQYFEEPALRAPEIDDCAALIRYSYREALRFHDTAWARESNLAVVPAIGAIGKYDYPHTPLNGALFRVRSGPFQASDLSNGAFLQFADAKTLLRYNTHVFSRSLSAAKPGDLLFYRRQRSPATYHSMIYLGPSQLRPDGRRYVLYHTGPRDGTPGELRRLTVDELEHFPQPEWRPTATNPSFLGIARWNILQNVEQN